jgi:hypothetical protein
MPDAETPSDGARPPLGSAEELARVWETFRSGGVVRCPADGSPLALSVDAAVGTYRFVCTACGLASAWFEAGPAGLRLCEPHQPQ